jgi:hypothetical protein
MSDPYHPQLPSLVILREFDNQCDQWDRWLSWLVHNHPSGDPTPSRAHRHQGDRRHRQAARHFGARSHYCRETWACELEGTAADLRDDRGRERRWASPGAQGRLRVKEEFDELLEMPQPNGRRLHSRYRLSSGVLGCRPASFRLEAVYGLQEQNSHHDVSMHEVRAPNVVRGKSLVAKADVDTCQAATHTVQPRLANKVLGGSNASSYNSIGSL